ncbi:MAG: C4-dicarboxylate ABC transporter permease [Alphaproteobacteria bacterium HGW-Alphaproteobacteria-10]|nr:MAG: C4-dicarboxylate ABC transporter permease [Alphaproteobacteria bacterium HGW-Alphaproteobacteria-10]
MSAELAVLFGTFAGLLLVGTPIAFCLGVASFATVLYMGVPPLIVFQRLNAGISVFALMAIPFFIFAGDLMIRSGIAERLVRFAGSLVGHFRGGLGQVNIAASTLFGGVSGSAVADASAIGGLMIPQMVKQGYGRDFAVNVTITSAIISLLIPPSHNMIIYSISAGGGLSIADLFTAGILPGLLLAAALMVVTYFVARHRGYPSEAFPGARAIGRYAIAAIPGLILIGIIFGGVRSGVFTATESSCIAALYAGFMLFAVYRSASTFADFRDATFGAVRTTAMVLLVIGSAAAFGWLLALLQAPAQMVAFMKSLSDDPIVIFLLLNLLLLFLGAFMDMSPLIIITTPIFLPVVTAFGMDPIHFGAVLILNLGIGLCTPPVGSVLFVGCAVGKAKVSDVVRTIWPFYGACIVVLMLVTYIPEISLFLPGLFK